MQEYTQLTTEERGDIRWVTINRPVDRNSLNTAVMEELTRVLDAAEDGDARAIVISGQGETHFVGGADGVEMMQCEPGSARAFSRRIQRLFDRIEASPLITVAAINGLCFGGGFELALACDLRVMSETARVGLPEVKVGLIPGGGGTQRLVRLVGMGRAIQMIFTGRLHKAHEALELGLVHVVTSPEELEQGVSRLLEPILRNPGYAITLAKRALYATTLGAMEVGLAVESEQFSRCFERTYFRDLMKRQLREGVLTTTEDVSHLTKEGGPR